MSENSIDVDINFNLNDIKNIFEKIMEGTDTDLFKGLSDVMDQEKIMMGGSLFKDIESTEDKAKLLETLNKLTTESPIMNDIIKMVGELSEEGGKDSELIERTQANLINMLSMSKLMIKLIDERFPISADMSKELENMNKVLLSKESNLDDKIDLLSRTLNNIVGASRSAFKIITPTVGIKDRLSPEKYKEVIKQYDELKNTVQGTLDMISEADVRAERRIRTPQMRIEETQESFDKLTQMIEDLREEEGTGGLDQRRDVVEREDTVEYSKMMGQLLELMDHTKKTFDEFIEKTQDEMNISLSSFKEIDEIIRNVAESMEISDTIKEDIKTIIDILTTGLDRIEKKISEEIHIETIQEIFKQSVEYELIPNPKITAKEKKLDHLITQMDNTYNRLTYEYGKVVKSSKSRKILEEAGLSQTFVIPAILERAMKEKGERSNLSDVIFEKEDAIKFNLKELQDTVAYIKKSEISIEAHVGNIRNDITKLLNKMSKTEKSAGRTNVLAGEINRSLMNVNDAVNSAYDQMATGRVKIEGINLLVDRMIQEWEGEFPDRPISKGDTE